MKIFSIFDSKIGTYNVPFFCVTEAEAIRSFSYVINQDPESVVYQYAEDYFLYQIGEFDQETGSVRSVPQKSICGGLSLKRSVPAFDSGAPASKTPTPQASNFKEADK